MALILDDYHLVVSKAVHEQLAFFISRIPANFHLVLATRSDPLLPLARLRASGELAEVRTDDLRFEAIEADQLLNDVLGLNCPRRYPAVAQANRRVGRRALPRRALGRRARGCFRVHQNLRRR